MRKVIVIGLDGLEPKIVERLVEAGELPHLCSLRTRGGYSRLRTTTPAQTPVAWSTFATGVNPGGHGIFDFLGRDLKTYAPLLALNRYEQKSAFLPPKVVNIRRGTAIWEVLSQAGQASTILRCPCTYPPDNTQGRMLSGVGVPDLRGGIGTSTFFTSDEAVQAKESERVIKIASSSGRSFRTHLVGPRHPKTGEDVLLDITIDLKPEGRRAVIHSPGDPSALEVREGTWSDWLRVKFKTGMLQSVRGMVRFYLVQTDPVVELYASPVNFDPEGPPFPISAPTYYAADLADELGTFYTTGMVEDHHGLNNERFSEEAYLQQCEEVLQERARMMRYELARMDEGFFFCLFDTPDRLQHMFWRFREQEHPANREGQARGFERVIEEHYRACDEIVGQALQYADDETLFVVLSDHGMNSYQRGLNINTWLYENGLLALTNGMRPGDDAGDFFRSVDWSRTRAYALGLSGIYLNLKGREERGIVEEGEAEALKQQISQGLTGLADPEREQVAVRRVVTREQVYHGPYAGESPDLLVNFGEGYRVSWGTTLGGVPTGLFEDNTKKWSGDHMIDPALAPGVLFMNQPFNPDADMVDLAPTILAALKVSKGENMEGESLLL